MPKKKPAPEVELEQVHSEPAASEESESQEYELSQFIAENSESATFATVYKKSSTGQFERIGKYALTACDLDTIAQEYGGGVFRVRITTETGQFIKQFTTTYASPKPKPEKGGDAQGLMNILISQNQQNQQMLLKAIEVLGTRPQPTPTTELKPTDIIQMMTAVKSLTSSADNATETLLRGLEMGLSLGEKSSEGLSTVDRIVAAIPSLATALQTRKTALQNEVRKLAVKPNPTVPPALTAVESGKKPEEEKPMTPKSPVEARIFALLTNVRPHVQAAEKSNIPAAMLASYVANNIDEATARELLQYLNEKDTSGSAANISRLAQFLGISESYMNELYIQVVYAVDTMFPHDGEEREPETENTGADVAGN